MKKQPLWKQNSLSPWPIDRGLSKSTIDLTIFCTSTGMRFSIKPHLLLHESVSSLLHTGFLPSLSCSPLWIGHRRSNLVPLLFGSTLPAHFFFYTSSPHFPQVMRTFVLLNERKARILKGKINQAISLRSFEHLTYFCECLSVVDHFATNREDNLYESVKGIFKRPKPMKPKGEKSEPANTPTV